MARAAAPAPETALAIPALRAHLREVVESPAFKGSRRGRQFLHFIVEKTLAGHGDELKERNLGVELFGRDSSYDTGEDAIVRVTASDVRKRLHEYYSETDSAIRIELLAGSYTPQFRHMPCRDLTLPRPVPAPVPSLRPDRWRRLAVLAGLLLVMAAVASAWLWRRSRASESVSPLHVLPWSVLLQSGRQLQLVFADPDVSVIQELTGSQLSLSDYANRRYVARPEALRSEMRQALSHMRGVNVAAVDVGIAVAISRLAGTGPTRLKLNTARSLQLSAFRTDDDFIILGSPRSNPWSALFEDQLDFEFVRDPELRAEVIRNKRAQPGELPRYVPTARGWGTGHSFATIALVGNPNQSGKVLLVAGTSAEGTEAAGQFVANSAQFARTLQAHGIDPGGPPAHFQILLQVRTMAGSSSTLDVVACRRLTSGAPR